MLVVPRYQGVVPLYYDCSIDSVLAKLRTNTHNDSSNPKSVSLPGFPPDILDRDRLSEFEHNDEIKRSCFSSILSDVTGSEYILGLIYYSYTDEQAEEENIRMSCLIFDCSRFIETRRKKSRGRSSLDDDHR